MKDIEEKAIKHFNYLINDNGFTGPSIKNDPWITTIAYFGQEIGVELEIDFRDNYVFVLIVRLSNGKLPSDYFFSGVNKNRIHLETILNDRSKRKGLKSRDEFDDSLEKNADLLKMHLPTIILESGKIFC